MEFLQWNKEISFRTRNLLIPHPIFLVLRNRIFQINISQGPGQPIFHSCMAAEIEYIHPDVILYLAGTGLPYREDDILTQELESGCDDESAADEGSLSISGYELEEGLFAEEPAPQEVELEEEIAIVSPYTGREEMVVALIDTAVDTNHPALKNIFVEGRNFIDGTTDVSGGGQPLASAHGTFVCGIIAAGSIGQVKVMPLEVFGENGAYTSDIIAAIIYAEAQGARVVNCSFGSWQNNRALREVMEDSPMLFVVSAGNAQADLDATPIYPAAFVLENVISVTSINLDSSFSYYSNYSNTLVDIAARGRDVKSSLPGGGYGTYSGTSMSAGYVSAAAGWVCKENPGLTAAELKKRLCSTGDRLTHLQDKVKDGRSLNVMQALAGEAQNGSVNIHTEDDVDEQGYAASPEDNWTLYIAPPLHLSGNRTMLSGLVKQGVSPQPASGSRSLSSKTLHGYVWPMVDDFWGLGSFFVEQHDIAVELRPAFNTPPEAGLSTISVEAASSGIPGLGEFTIEDVPFGTYVLYIKRPGYLARAMMVTVSDTDPDIIELGPPGSTDNGIFNLWWGDCNGDLWVNNEDAMMVLELSNLGVNAFDPLYNAACDLNGDAFIDNEDILMVIEHYGCFVGDYAGTQGVDFFGGATLPNQVSLNAVNGKQYDITVSARDISSFNGMVIKVQYDAMVFDVVDLCAYTRTKETSTGTIVAAGITVTQVSPGEIRFTVNKAIPGGKLWAGALTTIRLKAKATTTSVVSVE